MQYKKLPSSRILFDTDASFPKSTLFNACACNIQCFTPRSAFSSQGDVRLELLLAGLVVSDDDCFELFLSDLVTSGDIIFGLLLDDMVGSGGGDLGLLFDGVAFSDGERLGLLRPGEGRSGSSFENTSTFCPFGVLLGVVAGVLPLPTLGVSLVVLELP